MKNEKKCAELQPATISFLRSEAKSHSSFLRQYTNKSQTLQWKCDEYKSQTWFDTHKGNFCKVIKGFVTIQHWWGDWKPAKMVE